MPSTFEDRSVGGVDDRVELRLGDQTILVAETYTVRAAVLTQPAAWSIRVGHGGTAGALLKKFRPNMKFQLLIAGNPHQVGTVDAVGAEESAGATEVTLRGRDELAPLHDDLIDAERAFNTEKYVDLVQEQLRHVGLGGRTIVASNRADRQVKAGVPIVELEPVKTIEEIRLEAGGTGGGAGGVTHVQVQARLGERRYEFLQRYLNMAGLFLWCASDGTFVLSEPNSKQKACAAIVRKVSGQTRNEVTVVSASLNDATEHRYAGYSVYGRGAGKKGGHTKALGVFEDTEMADLGFVKQKTIHSASVRTTEQANFLGRKMAAEDRRTGYQLRYVVSGHTVPVDGHRRMVWTPDTVVHVDDELLGVKDDMYLEACEYRRSPATETELTLVRRKDLVFGPDEF